MLKKKANKLAVYSWCHSIISAGLGVGNAKSGYVERFFCSGAGGVESAGNGRLPVPANWSSTPWTRLWQGPGRSFALNRPEKLAMNGITFYENCDF